MNRDDDFNRTLQAWLRREAPPQAPDRVLESALQRASQESQRRSWQQRLVGVTPMATLLRAAALAAVVAIAVIGGLQISKLIPDVGESSPSPTTEASPSATPPAGCVNPPTDITTLIDMLPTGPLDPGADPVACYGNAPLTFEATWYGGGVADCPSAPEPAWLACSSFSLQAAGDTRKVGAPRLFVAVDPSVRVSFSEPYAQVRLTGHFDDPAAQTCRDTQPMPGESPGLRPVAVAIGGCRSTFVVTDVTEVSDPSDAALVLRLEGGAEDGRVHLVTVLEDGRVITASHEGASHPTVERRLTAAGVQLLRDELNATGLTFLASTNYRPVSKPGVEPPGYGGAGPALVVGLSGGGTAVISWYFFNDEGLYFEPQPEAEALEAMYARLSTLDEWLPASAWGDAEARPYAPAQYRVHVIGNPWGGSLDDLVDVSEVSWPVSASVTDLLDQIVATSEESDFTSIGCSVLSAADAELVQAALVEAGAPGAAWALPSYRLGDRDAARFMDLVFEPILPRDDRGCDGGYSLSF